MKRSIRRHHYERIKKNWKERLRWSWYWDRLDAHDGFSLETHAAMLTRTHTNCSCWMCCNEREMEGPTLQEVRHYLSYDEYLMGL